MRARGRADSAFFWIGHGRAFSSSVNAQPSTVRANASTSAFTHFRTFPSFAERATSDTGFVAPCALRNS